MTVDEQGKAAVRTPDQRLRVIAGLQLRQPDSTAIDVAALLRAIEEDPAGGVLTALADAISGVMAALVALTDPQLVVVGGTCGTHPAVLEAVSDRSARLPRRVPLRAALITTEPSQSGAREKALHDLRAAVLSHQHAPARRIDGR